ncbi:WD domain-containing protein [Histoplasma capsulatum var. duboisii H88]|uniref:WD domain-containing protein n=1 Tax=Ajellomyces capsulatus (strain H88) TaxID=544711 RepID=A0A8A1LR32_AJEC8|nr:WD domain-containing protein [Histoplasma capsulatum var. duboisii H88]
MLSACLSYSISAKVKARMTLWLWVLERCGEEALVLGRIQSITQALAMAVRLEALLLRITWWGVLKIRGDGGNGPENSDDNDNDNVNCGEIQLEMLVSQANGIYIYIFFMLGAHSVSLNSAV